MNLWDKKISEFMDLVDSSSPTPGGGSSAALISVLGLSLVRMVGHLTVNKKKFQKLDEKIQTQFTDTLQSLLTLKTKIIPLIDEDTLSFNKIMAAYSLKKDSPEEIVIRKQAIKEATLEAIKVPFEVANLSFEAFMYFPFILLHGNKQALSDLGVSVLALASGIEGALYNVLINLIGFDDEKVISFYKEQTKDLLEKTHQFKDSFLKDILDSLEYS